MSAPLFDATSNDRDWWRAFLRTSGFLGEETALPKLVEALRRRSTRFACPC